MKWLGVMAAAFVWVASMVSAVHADPVEWRLAPPAGWSENEAVARQMLGEVQRRTDGLERADLKLWRPADNRGVLLLQWYLLRADGDMKRQLDDFDRGIIDGVGVASERPPSDERISGDLVTRDTTIDSLRGHKVRLHLVRRYQPAADGLHALVTMCSGVSALPECETAMGGARMDIVAGPAVAGRSGGRSAYQIGYMVGYASPFVIGLGLLLWFLLRRRR